MTDGHRQRRALSAAEQAIRALIAGDGDAARRAAEQAVELDQVGAFTAFGPLVESASGDLVTGGSIPPDRWSAIAEALGPGPLAALAEEQAEA